jgi:hypothetical protein
MYFFDGKLGELERLMTEKPGFNRSNGKKDKPRAKKKPLAKKATNSTTEKGKGESDDG